MLAACTFFFLFFLHSQDQRCPFYQKKKKERKCIQGAKKDNEEVLTCSLSIKHIITYLVA